ncbi:hypothetical protein MVEN_00690100 [Mycena venus]|uniref:Uncharacterized protein n=1 Tax=Mycena venus TaxID=2733690 RepID=A0A8H6YKL7_9AGAR|nr:hypothetical protein MVEN_00690100 [Mycena venus]
MALLSRFLLASLALTLVSSAAGSSRGELFEPLTPYVKALHARRQSVIGGLLRARQGCDIGESECGVDGCCDIGTSCCSGQGCCPLSTVCDGNGCCPIGKVCSGDSGQCAISTQVNCPDGNGCCDSVSDCATDANGPFCQDEGGGGGGGGGGGSPTATTTKKTTTTPTTKLTITTDETETTEHNSSPTHTVGGNSGDDTPIVTPTKSAANTFSTGTALGATSAPTDAAGGGPSLRRHGWFCDDHSHFPANSGRAERIRSHSTRCLK